MEDDLNCFWKRQDDLICLKNGRQSKYFGKGKINRNIWTNGRQKNGVPTLLKLSSAQALFSLNFNLHIIGIGTAQISLN